MGLPPSWFLNDQDQGAQQQAPQQSPAPQQDPTQQQPQNNAQNAGPVKAGLRGVLARMLGNFSYGAGQAMLKAAGDETDAERTTRLAQTAHLNAQTQLAQTQAQMMQTTVPVTLPNGAMVHLPPSMAKDIIKQQVANQGKTDAASIGKRFIAVPNVGLVDTQHPSGTPQVVAGTSPQGVTVTPDIAQQYNIPAQLVGKTIPLQQFTGLDRAGAMWAPTVSNSQQIMEVTGPDGQPTIATIPKITTTRKVAAPSSSPAQPTVPGAQPNQPAATPKLTTNKNGIKFLTGPDGKPLMGKAGADVGPAYDPQTNQYIITNRADAAASGYQNFQKSSPAQIESDRQLNNRVTDVQQKIDRYQSTFNTDLSDRDKADMAVLISDNHFKLPLGAELPTGFIAELVKSNAFQNMSPQGQQRFLAYVNARESMSGYQRVLTGSSRGGEHNLQLQLDTLASPLWQPAQAGEAFKQFKENLGIAAQGLPRMKGVQTPGDIENKFNPQQQSQQQQGMETRTYRGVTYQRKQGSNDPWVKASQ